MVREMSFNEVLYLLKTDYRVRPISDFKRFTSRLTRRLEIAGKLSASMDAAG